MEYLTETALTRLGRRTRAELDALDAAGKNAGELGSSGAEPGGLGFGTVATIPGHQRPP